MLYNKLSSAVRSKYWGKSSKFIYVAVDHPLNEIVNALTLFADLRLLNVIAIQEQDNFLDTVSYNPFLKKFYMIPSSSTFENYFPDKLQNLYGYQYKTFGFKEDKRWKISEGGIISGYDADLLRVICEHQNASFTFLEIQQEKYEMVLYGKAFRQVDLDFSVTTSVRLISGQVSSYDSVNLFETEGFCAIVPFPKRKSFFDQLLKPFDMWTWILIFLSISCSATVWYFLNNRLIHTAPSAGRFIFAFVANFVGQSIPLNGNHKMQKIILQLTVLLTFILGNAYQSLIIAFISNARYGEQFLTIHDMMQGNFTFHVNSLFKDMFSFSDDYPELKNAEVLNYQRNLDYESFASNKVVIITLCSEIEFLMSDMSPELPYERKPINFYYVLPEKFYSFYLFFTMSYFSPFGERMQKYSLRIFESGIKQKLTAMNPYEDLRAKKEREYYENEEYFLNLNDLLPIFYILIGGYIVSAFLFLMEIFVQQCLQKKRFRKCKIFKKKTTRRQFKVIRVRPVEA